MGESAASIRAKGINLISTDNRYVYKAESLPAGSAMINNYMLYIVEGVGLCRISAFLPWVMDDGTGANLRSYFERAHTALADKYGSSKRYDFIKKGSSWKANKDWMKSLKVEDRGLAVFWNSINGSKMPYDLEAIKLEATAISPESGLVEIGFEFKNYDLCIAESKNK